jgi:chromate reductase
VAGIENADGVQTMDHRDFRILGLAGSLRRASFHRGLVRASREVAPERMSCEGFDLARIPYFDQDVEDRGNPEPVTGYRHRRKTRHAISFPEDPLGGSCPPVRRLDGTVARP